MRRRHFLRLGAAAAAAAVSGCTATPSSSAEPQVGRMPDEGATHRRTWMAFGASASVWGRELLPLVQRDLLAVATAISQFEPVSMLVRPDELALAKRLVGDADITLVKAPLDDLWIRDSGPTFVDTPQGLAAVDFNFNGWGRKQAHSRDARIAALVTHEADARRISTDLVLEGGALEVDGLGTAIITESCVLNPNRNPGWSKTDVESELSRLLGITKVIWLPGIRGHDITDGHTDFYARFVRPGVVVAAMDDDPESFDYDVTRTHLDILRQATDVNGRPLQVEILTAPTNLRFSGADDDFAAGYINFYECNGAAVMPDFGDPDADAAAHGTLTRLFPDRSVVSVAIDGIAAGGGGIHCATQQEPLWHA
ncbi:agmatine deiminase family protein [Gordonia malaquae]|uniref:agmatine deiminase family protein n=1 Tax=Gordonia malaquae TaxID=410332 RepID=UPI0030FEDD7E